MVRLASVVLLFAATLVATLASAQQPAPPAPPPAEPPAEVDITQQCVDAHLATQQLKKANKLMAAKDQMLICVQEGCPPPIKADCGGWLGQIESQLPSIVVAAKDLDGKDTTDVRVSIDGVKVADQIDGTAVTVDPGPHEITCEFQGTTHIEKVVVLQAQKSRQIVCSFATEKKDDGTGTGNGGDTAAPDPGAPQAVAGYVIGVIALGGFAAFAALGSIGKGEADDLENGCGQTQSCTDEEIDPVRTKLIVADVSLVAGVALLAVSMGLILHHFLSEPDPDDGSTALRVDVVPTPGEGMLPGGAAAQLTVSF